MAATSLDPSIVVYEPPERGVPPLGPYVQRIWDHRALVWHLARTELKAKHYDTAFGKLWVIIDPLLMAATFYLVRLVLAGSGTADPGFYIAHLIMGISFFYFVSNIITGTARCILANKTLVLNTSAPRGVFPAVTLSLAVFELIPALVVYFAVHLVTGQPWGMSLLFLPVVVLLLTGFSLGFGLVYAPLAVYVRDTLTVLPYVMRVWLYITPVMFAMAEIPPEVKPLFVLNPLYPFFAMLEQIFRAEMPSMGYFLGALAWTVVAAVAGVIAFTMKEREFAVRL